MIHITNAKSGYLPTGREDKESDADYNEEVENNDQEGVDEADDDLGDEY